jgi:hypothetical protein
MQQAVMVEKELAHSPPAESADFATLAPLREGFSFDLICQ